MVHLSRATQALALLVVVAAPLVSAQITGDVPDLSTATRTAASSSASSTETSSTESSTTEASTTSASASATDSSSFVTTGTATNSGAIHISNLPTIAGAGIPTMIVPYTANAPFMQHSNLPEGTVFIVVGAVLAFMGACVLFWRGLVAWSINRSVRKSALASIRGSEKASTNWGGSSSGYNPVKGGGLYQDPGSSMSLDALNSQGKPLKSHFKDHDVGRASPPAGLFFSPTAQARHTSDSNPRPLSNYNDNRSSTYLPAGYYASPSAQAAGGAGATTIGGSLAPYARHSTIGPSPPSSPGLQPTRNSGAYRATSHEGLKPASRDGVASSSRNSYLDSGAKPGHSSGIYSQPSSSSLAIGNRASNADLPASRAPSAYLEDLFENHGSGPRERF